MKYVLPDVEQYMLILPRSMGKSIGMRSILGKVICTNPRAITPITYPSLFTQPSSK